MKTMVMLIGAGAVGKSTISRLLVGEGATEYAVELNTVLKGEPARCRVRYAAGPTVALAGSLKNGSDSISAMDALRQVIDLCLQQRDVVITDGVRCTCTLVDWLANHPSRPAVVFAHIAPPLTINMQRLSARRAARGVTEEQLPDKTYWNVFHFRARARAVWRYAQAHYRRPQVQFVEIVHGTAEQAATQIVDALRGEGKE